MDSFFGIIQIVMDVQQYPESHKEEIERLKYECKNLSNLIQMIGSTSLPSDLIQQITRNLNEAEQLLKKVPRKAGIMQSFKNIIPGQQVLPKLKDASENIHRTCNNLNTWMNCRIFSSSTAAMSTSSVLPPTDNSVDPQGTINSNSSSCNNSNGLADMRSHKHKKLNCDDLPKTLELTYQNNDDDEDLENQELFGDSEGGTIKLARPKVLISLELQNISNIYKIFEKHTINTRELFSMKLSPKPAFFIFQRVTYNDLADKYKDVARISREHAALDLIQIQNTSPSLEKTSQIASTTTQNPALQINQTLVSNSKADSISLFVTPAKEEECFATCAQSFQQQDEDIFSSIPLQTTTTTTAFKPSEQQPQNSNNLASINSPNEAPITYSYHCVIECKGANGISIYRKRENQFKQEEIAEQLKKLNVKLVQSGSWVDIAKGERVILFNQDSIALLKKDFISIIYTFSIDVTNNNQSSEVK